MRADCTRVLAFIREKKSERQMRYNPDNRKNFGASFNHNQQAGSVSALIAMLSNLELIQEPGEIKIASGAPEAGAHVRACVSQPMATRRRLLISLTSEPTSTALVLVATPLAPLSQPTSRWVATGQPVQTSLASQLRRRAKD